MSARLPAFVIWALVGASAAFWGLRLAVQPIAPPPHGVATADASTTGGDLTRLLGARPASTPALAFTPEAPSRYRLLGIVAAREPQSHQSVALIAIDGKPARAFPVGATVEGDLVLQSVSLRTAAIGPSQGHQTLLLEVPKLPVAATGRMPPGSPGLPAAVSPPMPPALAAPPPAGNVAPAVPVLPSAGGAAPIPVPGASPVLPAPPQASVPPGSVAREGEQTQ